MSAKLGFPRWPISSRCAARWSEWKTGTSRFNVTRDGPADAAKTANRPAAGGGIRGGRVVGRTDSTGGTPADRPVHMQEVFATLYRNLGIDTGRVKITDLAGRP